MSTLNTTTSAPGSNSDIPELPSALCLMQESNILHLLFHRNKNQHRLSKWWKDLSLLRSNVRKLIVELESVGELQAGKTVAPVLAESGMTKTQLKKLRKMEKEKEKEKRKEKANATHVQTRGGEINGVDAIVKARERVDARLRLMRRGVIPRAWVAFTGVVATTQFSALGMILLGVLGRIYEIIGPGSAQEQEAMKDVEEKRVRGVMGREVDTGEGGGISGWVHGHEETELLGGDGFDDDGGVIISRELVGVEEDEMEGLGTIVEQIGTEEREIPNSINAATKDTKTQDGESQVETAEQMPPIATSRKKNMLKKSKEIILPQPSLPSPRPSPLSKSVHTTPFFPDPLDFFSSTSATPGIASTPVITKPEKRKFKPESTKIDITNKPKTKKKKKGNVIDDLFEGLI